MTKQLVWKLPKYLDSRGVTRYELMQELGDGKGRIAYKWKNLPERLDTEALTRVLDALEKLTGEEVAITDVLEYGDEPGERLTAAGVPYTGDSETDEVLNDFPDILERIRKLEAGEVKLIPWEQIKAERGL